MNWQEDKLMCAGCGLPLSEREVEAIRDNENKTQTAGSTWEGIPVFCDECARRGRGMSSDRARCPECGMPTIPDREDLAYEEMLCERCYRVYEEEAEV